MTSELVVPAPAVLPASGSTTTSAPVVAPGSVDGDDDDNDDDDFQAQLFSRLLALKRIGCSGM
jgi:hypothetical protein